MSDINALLQRRAEIQTRVAELATIEADGEELSEEQTQEFCDLDDEFKALTAKIERAQQAESMAAATAQPVQPSAGPRIDVVSSTRESGVALAVMIQALASSRGDPRQAASYAQDVAGMPDVAAALNTGMGSAGGFIVPPGYVAELIELLRPTSVVRRMGAMTMPMPNGALTMPKLAGGATANYGAEGADITKSEQTFGQLSLSKKKLTALVPISNDLIRFSSPSGSMIVRDDTINALAQREDAAFIRDDGTGDVPKGLRYWAPAGTHVIAANATVNLANVDTDISKLQLALANANVRMIRPGYLMAPRTELYLMNLRDGNGNKAFLEMENGRFKGRPYATTTQIPINLGVGTDESEIYLVDFADAVIAEATGLILDVSAEAAYIESATLVSAFSRDQTVVRAITEHDFGMRHDESVAVLTGVTWGA